ncbi:MAG TPA: phosphoadenosine phosphosulfate reductase family protein [Candidatus Woesearchaeota archaeon]|nr:phosphoadenosine phosphosulfate reductase family protein [Candidatus Woesearchaeota archaeon]
MSEKKIFRKQKEWGFDAEDLIKQAISRHGDNIGVACSFGKDSMVVLHMALKYKPDIKVFFHNTGVEFPETIRFKDKIKKLWNLNLVETKPYKGMSFWKCVEKYGLPQARKESRKRKRGVGGSPRCCYYLKEKPAMLAFKEHKIVAIITGLMKCESRNRALLITRMDNKVDSKDNIRFCGQRYFAKSWGVWKYHPIAYWKEEDVWDYIKRYNVPVNPVYRKWGGLYKRCGCLPCTAYLDWQDKLSKSHPKLYRLLKQKECPSQKILTF